MKVRVLVLEDSPVARETITKLIEFLEKEGKRTHTKLIKFLDTKVEYTYVEAEFVSSIVSFKNLFSFKNYKGVILDDEVLDGNAFKQGLPEWARNKNPRVGIGLNSSDNHENLAKKVEGFDLAKNPIAIKSFLMRLKNEI